MYLKGSAIINRSHTNLRFLTNIFIKGIIIFLFDFLIEKLKNFKKNLKKNGKNKYEKIKL
jgi:hypothetical protein